MLEHRVFRANEAFGGLIDFIVRSNDMVVSVKKGKGGDSSKKGQGVDSVS